MGTQSTWGFSSEQLKMKFLIVCLFAAAYAAPEAEADAEADPALLYGGYGYPYAYGGYGHAYGGYGLTYGLPVAHTVVKAADAEEPAAAAVKTVAAPVADADAYYGHYAYGAYGRGYGYGHRYGHSAYYGGYPRAYGYGRYGYGYGR